MNFLTNNPITNAIGLMNLASVLLQAYQAKSVDWNTLQQALVSVGFFFAQDWNITGGTIKYKG